MNSGPNASAKYSTESIADALTWATPDEAAILDLLTEPPDLWTPLPGPQTVARDTTADVTGYGGAAGGGKTDLGIGLAVTQHTRSLYLRREAKNLQAVIDRAREILGDRGSFNANTGVWRGLPGGRMLEFGGCKDPGDEQSYRGRPHDLIVFDEADQFLEQQIRFIGGWLRTTHPTQRCRTLFCFNPPSSAEGEWLLRYFAPWLDEKHPRPAKPEELRWYAMVNGKEVEVESGAEFRHGKEIIVPKSRTFIPARLIDNPFLVRTNYGATLQAMPEPLRSQLLYGDFTIGRLDDAYQVIPTEWVRLAQKRWRPDFLEPSTRLSCLGVDVARGGKDQTVLAPRYGVWFGPLERHPGRATPDGDAVADLVWQYLARSGAPADLTAPINIDVIGVGASAYDACRRLDVTACAVNFGAEPFGWDRTQKLEFANLRAYAYWSLREALDPVRGDGLMLPDDSQLTADLTAPRWKRRGGKILIEEKDDIVKRLGRSPDTGDAVVMAHLEVQAGTGAVPEVVGGRAMW